MANKNNKNNSASTDLSQQSLQYLGLNKQPFLSEILSEKNFYKLPALEKISESLIHQIQFSDLLLIVEGLQGSGKTALFRQLIQAEIQNTKILSIQAEATDTLTQIQQKISLHMQDLGDDNHLDDNLKSLQMFDQTPLIIMDNAHVLSDITLQELLRYQQQLKSEHEVNLKLLMFANTGMSETLQKIADIQADHMYVQTIPEYTAKQANELIMHRLINAGYTGEVLFKDAEFEALLKKSIATPVNLMGYAAATIEKIVRKKTIPESSGTVKILAIVIIIAVAVAGAAYFYFAGQTGTTEDKLLNTETQDVFVSEPAVDEPVDVEQLELENTARNTPEQLDIISPDDLLETDLAEPAESMETTAPEESPNMPTADNLPVNEHATQGNIPAPIETPAPEPLPQPNNAIADKQTVEPAKPVAKQKPPVAIKPAVSPQPVISKPASHTKTKAPTNLHPALRELKTLGTNDASWIQQQSARAWTMQLLGAREPETLIKFVRKHRLGAKVAWYKTMLKGKPYYVLIHGSYPNRDTARASISKLTPQLRALKPWVKSMKAVQQAAR